MTHSAHPTEESARATAIGSTEVLKKGPIRVSIYNGLNRGRGKSYWQVAYNIGGLRKKKNFGSEEKARRQAEHVLEALSAGRADLSSIDPVALGAFTSALNRFGQLAVMRALDHLFSTTGTRGPVTCKEACDSFLAAQKSNHRSPRHIETTKLHLNRFQRAFRKNLADIVPADFDDYFRTISPNQRTRYNHRLTLISLSRFAQRKGWLLADRKTAAELSEKPTVVHGDPEIFTPAELRNIIQAIATTRPDMLPFIVVGAFAGCRAAEIGRLKWSDWNPADQTIILGRGITKTRRRRIITVENNLAQWLNKLSLGKNPEDHILPLLNPYRALAPFLKGVVRWKQNGLRHSYASYHLEKYENAPLTSKNCGHSVRELETVYLKLTTKEAAHDWFSICPIG